MCQWARAYNLAMNLLFKKKQIDVSFSCVLGWVYECMLSPRGSTVTVTTLWQNSWSIMFKTDAWKTDINLLNWKRSGCWSFCGWSGSLKVLSCCLILVTVIYVCIFLGGYLLAYTPHTGIQLLDLDDAEPAFPIFNIHVSVSKLYSVADTEHCWNGKINLIITGNKKKKTQDAQITESPITISSCLFLRGSRPAYVKGSVYQGKS